MSQRLTATNTNAAPSAARLTKSAEVSGATNAPGASGITECPIKFVCVPRPFWDFRLEYKGESDDDDEDENADSPREKAWNETLEEASKTWLRPAAEFSGYTWTLSLKARKLNKKYDLQTHQRDQDAFGMFIYNDYTGYGLQEVIQKPVVCVQQ